MSFLLRNRKFSGRRRPQCVESGQEACEEAAAGERPSPLPAWSLTSAGLVRGGPRQAEPHPPPSSSPRRACFSERGGGEEAASGLSRSLCPLLCQKAPHQELAKQYGNIYTIWIGHIPTVVLSGFQAVKEVLINQSEAFAERPLTPFLKAALKERGIVLSKGHTWKQQRRFAQVTMRRLGLGKKGLEHQIEEVAQELVEIFARAKGQPLDPMLPITNSACNVICTLAFGHRFSLEDKEFLKLMEALESSTRFIGSFFHTLYEIFPFVMKHLPGPHQKTLLSVEMIRSFVRKEVERHKEHHSLHEPRDFIDFYLLQMEKNKDVPDSTFDDENLSQAIFDLFLAGTDTTSGTLQWALLLMASHPDIQDKVHKEIEDVFGSSQIIHYQDRKKLPYTTAVIHEVMRSKYVVLFGLPRRTTEDVNMLGYFIPKGTLVVPDFRSVLLDPKEWETPDEFNPHHFLDKDGHFVEKDAFLPFGAGLRACVGEQLAWIEIFIFFTSLLRSFTFRPPEGVKELNQEPVVGLTTHPHPYKLCAIPTSVP
ncbi:cytochrome P450 2J2-like isoform X1 [Tiliqua scincoides]|uniref:cytochrome P450 2J2-like isoform X1 n=1 Tax=Tiliqua scincoides TaxID=71010 RepID=UPI003462A7EF